MAGLNTKPELTPDQIWQVAHFDAEYCDASTEVNFEQYSDPRFGPWNSHWYVYDVVSRLHRHAGQRLLSFGCGKGADALRYARMGYDCWGFDLSAAAIDVASRSASRYNLQSRCRFSVQPAEEPAYPSGFFDLVVGVDILHHVDVERAIPQVARVLRPGGVGVFREPLATPRRDRLRDTRLVRWLIPKGTKSLRKKLNYGPRRGEHTLGEADFSLLRKHFGGFELHRWRLLALLSVIVENRRFLERCDWALFRMLPFLRRFGDQAVLIVQKPQAPHS
jgi:2-polyprenyl-3-methyl-5-hydroxy-6-metoxy-1,4-benzoquinol methylase